MRYATWNDRVLDTETGTWIAPGVPGWRAYQLWLDAGNTPDEYVPPVDPPLSADEIAARDEITNRATIREQLRVDAAVNALKNRTPAQVDAWIESNVNSLADAKAVLKIIARILALLARERL